MIAMNRVGNRTGISSKAMGWLAAAAFLAAGAGAAEAASMSYGNFMGSDVSFVGVVESSGSDAVPLYATPHTVGNALDFDPTSFASLATAGSADFTDGQINFTIQAKPGKAITSLNTSELGDYSLIGVGGVGTSASVGQVVFIKIIEIDNVALTAAQSTANVITLNTTFSPSGGTYNLFDEGPGTTMVWSGAGMANIAAKVAASGLGQYATKVEVASNNNLNTTSEIGTGAFIAKKDVVFNVGTAVVPEPTSLGLLGGIGLLALRRRRA